MDVDADCQLVKDYIAFGLILKQDAIILIVPALNITMTKELQYVKSGLLIIRYLNLVVKYETIYIKKVHKDSGI